MIQRILFTALAGLALGNAGFAQPPAIKVAEQVAIVLGSPGDIDARRGGTPAKEIAVPKSIVDPAVALPKADEKPPLPPLPERAAKGPVSPKDPPTLIVWLGEPSPPRATALPAGPLAKQVVGELKSADLLPVLGAYVRDRVSLSDPSMEISAQSILTPQNPERLTPAPFMAWNLPDPFENATIVRLRAEWPEATEPPLSVGAATRR